MAISVGTTFTGGNFVGELFHVTPMETTFLSMAGGLNGGRSVNSKQFTWQTTTNTPAPTGTAVTAALEGADPSYAERTRSEVSNVVQIFQYGYQVSYTRQAATQQLGVGGGTPTTSPSPVGGMNPVTDELAFQTRMKLEQAAQNVDWTLLNGTYLYPDDNSTARTTRGLLAAITTNSLSWYHGDGEQTFTAAASTDVFTDASHGFTAADNGMELRITTAGTGGTGLNIYTPYFFEYADGNTFYVHETKSTAVAGQAAGRVDITADTSGTWKYTRVTTASASKLNDLFRMMWDSGAPMRQPVLFCNAGVKQVITDIYAIAPQSRNVGGVNITQIETDFGVFGVALERNLDRNTLLLADMSVIRPAFLAIPGKGHFFTEEVAHTGASWNYQLYGEIGLEYGPELWHGKLTGVSSAV